MSMGLSLRERRLLSVDRGGFCEFCGKRATVWGLNNEWSCLTCFQDQVLKCIGMKRRQVVPVRKSRGAKRKGKR
jgi:hypothetical protein